MNCILYVFKDYRTIAFDSPKTGYFSKIIGNFNDAGQIDVKTSPMIIVSNFNESDAICKQENSTWWCVSDESFVSVEKMCESPKSPYSENDSEYETKMQDMTSISSESSLLPIAFNLPNKFINKNRDNNCLSRIEEDFDGSDDEDMGSKIENKFNDTVDEINFIIEEGKRLIKASAMNIKVNYRVTLSPTRARLLQGLGHHDNDAK